MFSISKTRMGLLLVIGAIASSNSAFAWHCHGHCAYTVIEVTPIGSVAVIHTKKAHGSGSDQPLAYARMLGSCPAGLAGISSWSCKPTEIIIIGKAGEGSEGDTAPASALQDSCNAVSELALGNQAAPACSDLARDENRGLGNAAAGSAKVISSQDLFFETADTAASKDNASGKAGSATASDVMSLIR